MNDSNLRWKTHDLRWKPCLSEPHAGLAHPTAAQLSMAGRSNAKKMLQMPRLERTQSLYNHLMAITQPVGSQGFITEAQKYFLKLATIIYNHSGCFHPHTLVSHQPTWSKLGGTVVTCSVISITVCSFRCAEAPRGDVRGQAVPKGTGQHCVCLR